MPRYRLPVVLLLLLPCLGPAWSRDAARSPLVIEILDVAHGDAALVRTPQGRVILMDAGDGGRGPGQFDAGTRVILPRLRRDAIDALAWLIATHPHNDHIGGIGTVLAGVRVGTYLDPGMAYPSRQSRNILRIIQEQGISYRVPRRGETLAVGEGVSFEVLGPPPALFRHGGSPANDNSLVLMLRYGDFAMLFLGDAEIPALESVLATASRLACQVVKVSHHGSRTGFHADLLRRTGAAWALVSTCSNNRYGNRFLGLPHPEVLAGLAALGMGVLRTDVHGTLTVETDGTRYTVRGEHGNNGSRPAAP